MRSLVGQGLLGSVLVALSGLVLGRTPPGDWTSRLDPLADGRAGSGARLAAYLLAFAGVAILTLAWLRLGRLVRGRPDGPTQVGWTALVWALPFLPIPPLYSGDGWSYAADGLLVGDRLSPYAVAPAALGGPVAAAVSPHWVHTVAPYGPLAMLWGGGAAHLWADPWFVLYAYRALALVGLALLAYAVPRLAAVAGVDPATATWLAVASPVVLVHGVGGVHLDLVMAGLMTIALLLAATSGWVPGAVLAGLAVAVKTPAIGVVVGVALVSLDRGGVAARLRRVVAATGVAVGTALSVGLLGGLGVAWIGSSGVSWTRPSWLSPTRYAGRAVNDLAHLHAIPAVSVGAVVLLLVVAAVVVLRTPVGVPGPAVAATALVVGLGLLVAPLVHYWYFLWCLPLFACTRLGWGPTRLAVALAVVLGLLAPLDASQHLPYEKLIVLVVLGATAVVASVPPRAARVAQAAALGLARMRP